MLTLSDLAKDMKLSEATISNALNGKGRMRPETRAAIIKRAQELGYTTRPRNKKKKNIIVIAENLHIVFVSLILQGICLAANEHQTAIPIYNIGTGQERQLYNPNVKEINETIESLIDKIDVPLDGIIFVSQYARKIDGLLSSMPFPVVSVFCTREEGASFIHYDDKQGAYLAVSHLIDSGCENIAMISGPIDSIGMFYRTSGYQRALIDHGLSYDPNLTRIGNWTIDSGYSLVKDLLRKNPQIDSIFAQNDQMAIGAMYAIQDAGLRVPQDISIIGFDNSEVTELHRPKLSSVAPPFEEMGRSALQMIFDLQDPQQPEVKKQIIPCSLIHKETTNALSGQKVLI